MKEEVNNVVAGSHEQPKDLGDLRFYDKKYPEPNEVVMVRVNRIEQMGAYVALLEYNCIEGMILLSELSKRRFRSINKLIKVGRHDVAMVIRTDQDKGYIDLSKKRVSPEDIVKCEDRYSRSKKVQQTVRHVSQKHNIPVEEINRLIIWPLHKHYGHAMEAFEEAAINPEEVFADVRDNIAPEVLTSLVEDIQLRLAPTLLKVRAPCNVSCVGYDGVEAIKTALIKGKEAANQGKDSQKNPISIRLISPPLYLLVTTCYDREDGRRRIATALETIEETITKYKGGSYQLAGEITVVGGEDEKKDDNEDESDSSSSESGSSEDEEDEQEGIVANLSEAEARLAAEDSDDQND